MNQTLTLGFSALGDTLPTLINNLEGLDLPDSVLILVVVQKHEKINKETFSTRFDVRFLDSVGLSKSRNAVINYANTDFLWLLDDDVDITNEHLCNVMPIINQNSANFYRVKIGCKEWHEQTFKPYKKVPKVSKLNLLQVSSIEIIADVGFIKQNNILFNENIGLGTEFQGGEEIHFLIDAWEKGAKFEFIDQVLVRHTCIFEARVLATQKIFEVRGATASRYGALGYLLLIRWGGRYLLKERKLSYIRAMLKGFFRGYSYFK